MANTKRAITTNITDMANKFDCDKIKATPLDFQHPDRKRLLKNHLFLKSFLYFGMALFKNI